MSLQNNDFKIKHRLLIPSDKTYTTRLLSERANKLRYTKNPKPCWPYEKAVAYYNVSTSPRAGTHALRNSEQRRSSYSREANIGVALSAGLRELLRQQVNFWIHYVARPAAIFVPAFDCRLIQGRGRRRAMSADAGKGRQAGRGMRKGVGDRDVEVRVNQTRCMDGSVFGAIFSCVLCILRELDCTWNVFLQSWERGRMKIVEMNLEEYTDRGNRCLSD